MSTGPNPPISRAIRSAQDWERLSSIAIDRAIALYLHGCAEVAMARTPMEALAALLETQAAVLRHFAEVLRQADVAARSPRSAPRKRPPSAAKRQFHGSVR
jgi:hypothetical protein